MASTTNAVIKKPQNTMTGNWLSTSRMLVKPAVTASTERSIIKGMLIALIVPASIPLWQLAMGVAFAVEIDFLRGRELLPAELVVTSLLHV